jgi:hypothetical protein
MPQVPLPPRALRQRPQMHHFHVDGQVVPFLDYLEIKVRSAAQRPHTTPPGRAAPCREPADPRRSKRVLAAGADGRGAGVDPQRQAVHRALVGRARPSLPPCASSHGALRRRYTAPDEFLASGEALVRNLLNGWRSGASARVWHPPYTSDVRPTWLQTHSPARRAVDEPGLRRRQLRPRVADAADLPTLWWERLSLSWRD